MGFKDYIIGILFSLVVALGIWLSFEIQSRDTAKTIEKDSTTVVKRDTIPPPDSIRTVEPEIPEPDTVYEDTFVVTETDTFQTKDTTEVNYKYTRIRDYKTTISDSLIEGTIETTVQGFLIDQEFNYKPSYPLKIKVRTNTRVTERIAKTQEPRGFPSIGLNGVTDFKTLKGYEITGSWTMKNRNRIRYEYNPPLGYHTIGFSYNLRNFFNL